jgi:hypothetical protein
MKVKVKTVKQEAFDVEIEAAMKVRNPVGAGTTVLDDGRLLTFSGKDRSPEGAYTFISHPDYCEYLLSCIDCWNSTNHCKTSTLVGTGGRYQRRDRDPVWR